ncbi:MAG TPA: peptidylprolyl isomerase [Steroidobacteraceae bacterium]|nr:peptidylprolyl isomerase [Steroidobacteraceae bacterium]
MSRLARIAREPLVHFVVLGALLFLYFEWGGVDGGPDSRRIVVSAAQVEHLAAAFARTWQRPPSVQELKGLVDDYVREEIAVREARAMGLDADDAVIRRRLRQKLEFITQDVIDAAPATEEQLEAWYREHLDDYTAEAQFAFEQVFVDRDRRGPQAEEYAATVLAQLRSMPQADADELGDPTMLPADMPLSGTSEIARTFGVEFARQLATVTPGEWAGPIVSGFGLHLVRVNETAAARPLEFEAVAPLVERDFLADRRKREMDAFYARLLENYDVELDLDEPDETESAVAASSDEAASRQ